MIEFEIKHMLPIIDYYLQWDYICIWQTSFNLKLLLVKELEK